jgi:hypothetical protein
VREDHTLQACKKGAVLVSTKQQHDNLQWLIYGLEDQEIEVSVLEEAEDFSLSHNFQTGSAAYSASI